LTTIKNITKTPLRVPLPADKRLFLGPGKSSQITPKAAKHPPLKELIESGEVEIGEDAQSGHSRDRGAGPAKSGSQRQNHGKPMFKAGDN